MKKLFDACILCRMQIIIFPIFLFPGFPVLLIQLVALTPPPPAGWLICSFES